MYLVAGVTGNIGSEVAAALLGAGHAVRGIITDPSSAATLPAGVEPVVGDLNRADTLVDAVAEAHGLFLLPGYDGAAALLDVAATAGVARVVQLSGGSAGSRDMSNAVTAYMARAEDVATGSGLGWTILRPNAFMSNTLRWRDQLRVGTELRLAFADVPCATIDPADIGAVAAAALTEPTDAHLNRIYRLSGPTSLTPAEQAALLGEVLGRPLRVIRLSDEEARADMLTQMPPTYVDAFMDFYALGSLDESAVLPTVQQTLNRPPSTFTNWLDRHKNEFLDD